MSRRNFRAMPAAEQMPGPGDVYWQRQLEEDTQLARAERASDEYFDEPEPREWQPCDGNEQP